MRAGMCDTRKRPDRGEHSTKQKRNLKGGEHDNLRKIADYFSVFIKMMSTVATSALEYQIACNSQV